MPAVRICQSISPGNRSVELVLGTLAVFALSGIMHDYGLNAGVSRAPTLFGVLESTMWFTSQGLMCVVHWLFSSELSSDSIVLERLFTQLTGRRVGGPLGRAWTYAWIIGSGSFLARSWLDHGLADGLRDPWTWQVRLVRLPCHARLTSSQWWRFVLPFSAIFP